MGLRSKDEDLRDVVVGRPLLVDSSGEPTGIRLARWIGSGGMSTVLLGELDPALRGPRISPLAPRLLAIKLQRLSTERQLERINLSPMDFARKELVALRRVMDRKPPTEFVVGYYGSGTVPIDTVAGTRHIPWLALEYVDGGAAGSTLEDRVAARAGGLDPVRALRLARGILEGVAVLHEAGILHRDLKPGNVFVTGPVDDETPKIADCGIARVQGLSMATIAALTPAYAGPEQLLSLFDPTRQNPLVGTWSDVHAAATLLWFVIAGEAWCRGDTDAPWHAGHRRSLATADRLHEGFAEAKLIKKLDTVFEVAAAHRVPKLAWQTDSAAEYERIARLRFRESMFEGPERYPDIPTLRRELLPLLERAADAWLGVAAKSGRPSTLLRETRVTGMSSPRPQATVEEIGSRRVVGTQVALSDLTDRKSVV